MKTFWNIYMLSFLAIAVVFVGIAVVAFGAGGLNYVQEEAFFAKAESAMGTITAYELHVRNSGLAEYCPRIEYTTTAGEPFAYQGGDCPNAPDTSKIGQQVQLYYDPKNPKDHRTKGFGDELTGLTVGVIAGVFCLLMAAFMFVPNWGIAVLARRLTANQAAAKAAKHQRYVAGSEAASEAVLREGLLARGASEAEAEEKLQNRRLVIEQVKAKQAQKKTDAEPPADGDADPELAELAQMEQQEAELKRKIDERRRQSGQ